MNIWDSVQRGLEKASHEAARIAKTQRLRATIDTLSRQIQSQQSTLIQKTMELFANGQLTQSELLTICQSLTSIQQQLAQAQNELKQIPVPAQQGNQPALPAGSTAPYPTPTATFPTNQYGMGEGIAPTIYAPLPPLESTTPIPVPPPPPGIDATISQQRTTLMGDSEGYPAEEKIYCSNCHSEVISGHAFCQNCGTPVKAEASYLPTTRGTFNEQLTIRAPEPSTPQDGATERAEPSNHPDQSGTTPSPLTQQDGG